RDPYNERMAHDPFGANSVVFVEGYERPEWTHEDREARKGKLEEHLIASTAFGEVRKFRVYVPARFRTNRRHPLLIVHDGRDFLNFAGLQTVLDNLIHRYEIPPTVVALLDSDDRLNEYANNEQHARFVVEELVPAMSELYPLHDRPDARVLMGASFGAVATLSTAWRYQGTFGKLLLQSGSFAFTDIGEHDRGPVFDPVVRFVNAFRDDPGRPAEQVHVSCGIYERLIYENRSLVPLLQSAGMSVRFEESRDGHDWENWRDRLRGGLSWLLPGPLWFVYE
ncbi:MAG: alpha/beta hydrolase-fold protein, partial [Acidobacteriota bacterium]